MTKGLNFGNTGLSGSAVYHIVSKGSQNINWEAGAGMIASRVDSAIPLSDGRRLAYAEYGAANGIPVFLFHGLPGSRLSWGLLPNNPFPKGLRLIAPDRPGYGGSDPKPGRSLLDWVDDVVELADALAIDRFAVLGVSGGGPGGSVASFV